MMASTKVMSLSSNKTVMPSIGSDLRLWSSRPMCRRTWGFRFSTLDTIFSRRNNNWGYPARPRNLLLAEVSRLNSSGTWLKRSLRFKFKRPKLVGYFFSSTSALTDFQRVPWTQLKQKPRDQIFDFKNSHRWRHGYFKITTGPWSWTCWLIKAAIKMLNIVSRCDKLKISNLLPF